MEKTADRAVVRPYFESQRTFDLQRWEPIGERQRAATAMLVHSLSATLPLDDSNGTQNESLDQRSNWIHARGEDV